MRSFLTCRSRNVAFGLEARGVVRAARLQRARAALASLGWRMPGLVLSSVSGGEQQRVALARALVIEPRVLLMDEPLSNLDPTLRQWTRDGLRSMLHRVGVPALFVTHDQEDAFAIADRIALIRKGKLLQVGTPEDLHDRPASMGVATFIGRSTILPAEELGNNQVAVTVGGLRRELDATSPNGAAVKSPRVVLRPDALEIASSDGEVWRGKVINRRFTGGSAVYRIQAANDVVLEVNSQKMDLREGETAGVTVKREPVPVVSGEED